MATCTPEALAAQSKCLRGLGRHWLLAIWAKVLCAGAPPPPTSEGITTDPDGLVITTDDGHIITIN